LPVRHGLLARQWCRRGCLRLGKGEVKIVAGVTDLRARAGQKRTCEWSLV
jgi:hypothetical protein